MDKEKVMIIEDDNEISSLIRDYLKASGYDVYVFSDGHEGLDGFNDIHPDIIVVDLMLPGADGFEICRKIRAKSSVPIIILSARQDESDKILGLGLGADDYITKPFSPRELIARVQSHLRRFKDFSSSDAPSTSNSIATDDFEIDPTSYTVKVRGKIVPFSIKEFDILYMLAKNPGVALSREKIFDKIWGFNEYGDINTVTVHIRKIREKIELDPSNPEYIETVWGIGYKFKGK